MPNKAGDTVWVVERNEGGEAVDVSWYVFLAKVRKAVVVSPALGESDIDTLLKFQMEQTAESYHGYLAVFSADDCFSTREEAEAAMKEGDA